MAKIYQASNIYVFGLLIGDDFYQQDGTRCDYIGKYLHLNFVNNPFVTRNFEEKKNEEFDVAQYNIFKGIGRNWVLWFWFFFPL